MGRPNTALGISDADREQLRAMVRSHSMPHALVRRAQIVLLSGEGKYNREIARRCGISAPVVSHWRRRYQERGLAGCTMNSGLVVRVRMTTNRWQS